MKNELQLQYGKCYFQPLIESFDLVGTVSIMLSRENFVDIFELKMPKSTAKGKKKKKEQKQANGGNR